MQHEAGQLIWTYMHEVLMAMGDNAGEVSAEMS